MIISDSKYLFPIYQTRDDVINAGLTLRPFNSALKNKNWIDPNPKLDEDGFATYSVFAYSGNVVRLTKDGQPKIVEIKLSKDEAMNFNIPALVFDRSAPEPQQIGFIPTPLVLPKENERWEIPLFGEPRIVKKAQQMPEPKNVSVCSCNTQIDKLQALVEEVNAKVDRLIVFLSGLGKVSE